MAEEEVGTVVDEDPLGVSGDEAQSDFDKAIQAGLDSGMIQDNVVETAESLEGVPQMEAPDFGEGRSFGGGTDFEDLIAEFASIKDQKDAHRNAGKALNAQEDYIEKLLLSKLGEEGLENASAERGTASRKETRYPSIKDWPVVLAWLMEYGHTELLKKSLNSAPARALEETGVEIPGVEWYDDVTLGFRRKKGK